jgi:general stress protein YciG
MASQNQGQTPGTSRSGMQNRGFASMSDAEQREIARMGGAAVSEDREHMAQIGRKGGQSSAEARAAARNQASANAGAAPSGGQATSPASGRKPGDASMRTGPEADGGARGGGDLGSGSATSGSKTGDR